jgi:hypothetical protein
MTHSSKPFRQARSPKPGTKPDTIDGRLARLHAKKHKPLFSFTASGPIIEVSDKVHGICLEQMANPGSTPPIRLKVYGAPETIKQMQKFTKLVAQQNDNPNLMFKFPGFILNTIIIDN